MSSPLTPLLAQKHELELEINNLKDISEQKKRQTEELAEAVTDMLTRISSYEQALEDIHKESSLSVEFIKAVITEAAQSLRFSHETLDGAFKIIARIEAKIDEKTVDLKNQQQFERDRRIDLHKDMEDIGRMKTDLAIYHDRLQKKYDELGLGQIIL